MTRFKNSRARQSKMSNEFHRTKRGRTIKVVIEVAKMVVKWRRRSEWQTELRGRQRLQQSEGVVRRSGVMVFEKWRRRCEESAAKVRCVLGKIRMISLDHGGSE